ncbi:hypothetical protein BdPhPhi1402_gp09 [Bdellovibrio phage phi1402]|uniref:hypothetical protein n=1 Tax=Bdellovibrio phage phi1402 TaxID=1035662 RepID=UPI000211A2C7|nr:hypothetical protein BdPhPhi1402_gp09 [Bdellovibrio phage phi1402]AEG42306.1 hypothetical protein [Bdellovibrio phage phi1402]
MKIGQLAALIAKKEGHKSESRIGDIREVLAILSDLSYGSPEPLNAIVKNGIARAKKKSKNGQAKGQKGHRARARA